MAPRVWLTQLLFSDETLVSVSPDDLIVIVGPNNVGKTAALRAIRDKLHDSAILNPVLKSISVTRVGELSDVISSIAEWAVTRLDGSNPVFNILGRGVYRQHIEGDWQRADANLPNIGRWFCHLLTADERLQISNPVGNSALTRVSARAVRVFAAASRLVGRAIGHELTQDRGFGRGDDGLDR